jgi:hypothetical protein
VGFPIGDTKLEEAVSLGLKQIFHVCEELIEILGFRRDDANVLPSFTADLRRW